LSNRSSRSQRTNGVSKGLGVFKGGGISVAVTPTSKKFAPAYATSHSLTANKISSQNEINIQSDLKDIKTKLLPKRNETIKDFNNIVDSQLKQVVEKIN